MVYYTACVSLQKSTKCHLARGAQISVYNYFQSSFFYPPSAQRFVYISVHSQLREVLNIPLYCTQLCIIKLFTEANL